MAIANLSNDANAEPITRNRSCCRSFARVLCSNLGLLVIITAYCIGGAYLFILLEQYIESQNCQRGSLLEELSAENLSETMYSYVIFTNDNDSTVYTKIESYLNSFQSEVYERRSNYRYTGQDCSTTTGWTFGSALLFTISTVAAIGYGHISPTSWEGQITCICYSLIGIPIFLVCLTNISSILGDIFRFCYAGILHGLCCMRRIISPLSKSKEESRKRKSSFSNDIYYVGSRSADPSWPEADERYTDDESDDGSDSGFNGVWNQLEYRVPTALVLVVIVGYLFLGGFMFQKMEDWSLREGIYFSYISLSTVGFGDYVPGITSGSVSPYRFFAASIYIVIGLSILAMCFDLLKESMVDKVRWMGHKAGFIADDEDRIDIDRTRYANFEYTDQMNENRTTINSASTMRPSSTSLPPTYETTIRNENWITEFRDKDGMRINPQVYSNKFE